MQALRALKSIARTTVPLATDKCATQVIFNNAISLGAVRKRKVLLLKNPKSDAVTYFEIPNVINCKIEKSTLHVSSDDKVIYDNFLNLIARTQKNLEFSIRKKLILFGLGFRIFNRLADKSMLEFKLGYSHLMMMQIPKNKINFSFFKLKGTSNRINVVVEGTDSAEVGNFVAQVKRLKVPDAYKGKGFFDKGTKQVLKVFKKK